MPENEKEKDVHAAVKLFNQWYKVGSMIILLLAAGALILDTRTKAVDAYDATTATDTLNILRYDNLDEKLDSLVYVFKDYFKYQKIEDSIRTEDIKKLDKRYEDINKYLREH